MSYVSIQQRVEHISNQNNLSICYMPIAAKIEICGKCTLDCNFCYYPQIKNTPRSKLMSVDDFSKVLCFLKNTPSIKEVGLFYIGESGLHPQLAYFYKLLKDHGYFTFLTTNGTILNTVCDAIPYIDSLKVSWNYIDVDDFQKKTNRKQYTYYSIINNIHKLYDECHRFNKKLTVSSVLDRDIDDYRHSLSQLKYDYHYWIPLQTQCGINQLGSDGVVGEYLHQRSPIPCWSLFKMTYVDSQLNIRTCCYGHYDKHVLYNLNTCDKFMLTAKLQNMRKIHLDKQIPYECQECLKNTKMQ